MYFIRISSNTVRLIQKLKSYKVKYSTSKHIRNVEVDKIRNIGILAHIDAGKLVLFKFSYKSLFIFS